jgi:branched-chain amino acid transport system permease protein
MLIANVGEDIIQAVLQGIPPGSVYALIAMGFVLTYKTSGVFNLAFGAQAFVSAATYFELTVERDWPIVPAFIVAVLIVAPVTGLILERLIFRQLRTASAVAKLVVSIGLTVALPAIFELISGFEATAGRTPIGIIPDGAGVFYDPFGIYPWNRDEIAMFAIATAAVLALGALFKFTSVGLAMRAVVESPRMTELSRINSDRVSAFSWAMSSTFAGLAGVLIAPRFNTLVAPDFFSLVVLGIAAAAIGRLVSLPRAYFGGIGLGVGIALFKTFVPRWSDTFTWLEPFEDNIGPALPFVVLFAVLVGVPAIRKTTESQDPLAGVDPPPTTELITPRSRRTSIVVWVIVTIVLALVLGRIATHADIAWWFWPVLAAIAAGIWLPITAQAYQAVRDIEMPTVAVAGGSRSPELRYGNWAFTAVLAAIVAWWAFTQADISWLFLITNAVIMATIFLSITVITGFAGQISLCQATFGAIGAFTVFQMVDRFEMSVLLAAVVGGIIAAAVGAILSLPVLRLGGVWLAIATLAFAYFFDSVIVRQSFVGGGETSLLTGTQVPRPTLGPIDFSNDKSFLALAIVGFAVISVAVILVRGGTIGRTLRALRGSEVAAQSIGISPAKARITAFALSAFIAGLGGAMLAIHQQNVNYGNNFSPFAGLFWIVVVVVVSSRTVEGAASAGVAMSIMDRAVFSNLLGISTKWRLALFGLAAVQYARHPEGLAEYGRRRQIARVEAWLARRRGEEPPGILGADDDELAADRDEPGQPDVEFEVLK